MRGPEGRPPNVSPARKGWGIDSQHCPSAVGAAHFHLNLHQYSVEKHFQDEPAELQIPIRLRSGQALGYPGFPVELGGFGKLHAPFFTERRTRCRVQRRVAGNPGSLLMTLCRTYGAQILFGIDSPALPGWADVWRSALRASHPWRLPVSFLSQLVAGNSVARDDRG